MAHAELEMKLAAFLGESPGDDAIIGQEETEFGWRALTARGDVLSVRNRDGSKAIMPGANVDVVLMQDHITIGASAAQMHIGAYLEFYDRAIAFMKENRNVEALAESDAAMAIAPTLFARFNRSLILLALGRWSEGFAEYRLCETRAPFMRPPVVEALAAGMKPWDGENLSGKRILLIHAHGFGDTIMTLRYVPIVQALGASTVLYMPAELERLALPFAPVTRKLLRDCDYFCPMLHLPGLLGVEPGDVCGAPYLHAIGGEIERWRRIVGSMNGGGSNIGIAWSPGNGGRQHDGDYPRTIALDRMVALAGQAQLHSVQKHGAAEARTVGVHVHAFEDFADCAALMMAMDCVLSIDTAALHLAGAIGHPRVEGLVSSWASWRWRARWYDNVKLEVL